MSPEVEVSGYVEANAIWTETGGGNPFLGEATLRRVEIELEHDFGAIPLASEVEVEWENAIACDGCRGSVEAEEAFLTWSASKRLRVDAGLLLVPFGAINLHHHPDEFWSVDRPQVDLLVVPTTWRELGVEVRTVGQVRVRGALITTPDPTRFGATGLAPANALGSKVRAGAVAAVARVEADPMYELGVGASLYATDLGRDGDFYDSAGDRLKLWLPLGGGELDARADLGPVGLRGELAAFTFPEAGVLLAARREDGSPYFVDDGFTVVPTRWYGGWAEASVDVGALAGWDGVARPFARVERYDTTAAVPEGFRRDPSRNAVDWVFGVAVKPWDPVIVKADVDLRDRKRGLDDRILRVGLGWTF